MNKNQSRFTILQEVFCGKKDRGCAATLGIDVLKTSASYALQLAFPVPVFWIVYAVIHFNSNLHRKNRMKNGVEQVHVVYPKFKNGEAVVRNVKVQQNFGM